MKTLIEGNCGRVVIEESCNDMPLTPVRVFVHECTDSAAAFFTVEEAEVLVLHLQLVIRECKRDKA